MQPTQNRIRSPKVGPGPSVERLALSTRSLISLVILAVLASVVLGTGALRGVGPLASSTGLAVVASADNLRMTVTAATDRVASGGELDLAISVQNVGASPVSLASWECGAPISVEATLEAPTNAGRDLADPLEAELRALAVTKPDANEVGAGVITRPPECAAPDGQQAIGDQQLTVGQELHAATPWRAELVDGVPAAVGDVTLTVRVAYRESGMEEAPYQPLVATTTLVVSDGEEGPISAAQALDAVLSEKKFAVWLRAAPSSSWTAANVFLQNLGSGDNGIVPAGPSWEVDVFRAVDGARQWAIAFVDPATGQVRSVNLCERECGTAAP